MHRVRLRTTEMGDLDITLTMPPGELPAAHAEPVSEATGDAAPTVPPPVTFEHAPRLGSAHAGTLVINGTRHRYRTLRRKDRIEVWVDGRVHRFEILSRTAQRSGGADAGAARRELVAPMPGTILRILVADGEAFAADQPLIVMESMKMEMTITSPMAGRVQEVCCAEGDLVTIDQVLLRRDEEPAE